MSEWAVYKKVSGTWTTDGTISRPNSDLVTPLESTSEIVKLEDGSEADICPEVKATKGEITFVWYYDDATLFNKISAYISSHDYVKITTHLSAIEFIGRFTSIRPTWLVGEEPDKWGIEATFKPFE